MKESRCRFGVAWLPDGRLFAVGGNQGLGKVTATVEMLACGDWNSPKGGASDWQYMAPLPSPRENHAVAVSRGKIVVAGGSDTTEVTVFTPPTSASPLGQWSTIDSLPRPQNLFSLVAVQDGLIGVGTFTKAPFLSC